MEIKLKDSNTFSRTIICDKQNVKTFKVWRNINKSCNSLEYSLHIFFCFIPFLYSQKCS